MGHPSMHIPGESLRRLILAEGTLSSRAWGGTPPPTRIDVGEHRLMLSRYDFDFAYRLVIPMHYVTPPVATAIAWAELLSVVKLIDPAESVSLTIPPGEPIEIRQGERWWLLENRDVDDAPPPPEITDGPAIVIPRTYRRGMIDAWRRVAPFAAAPSDNLPILAAVVMENKQQTETLKTWASDRYVAARETFAHYCSVPDTRMIVSATWVAAAAKAMASDQLYSYISLRPGTMVWLELENPADGSVLALGASQVDGEPPKIDSVFPAPEGRSTLSFASAQDLLAVLKKTPASTTLRLLLTDDHCSIEWWDDGAKAGVTLTRGPHITLAEGDDPLVIVGVARDKLRTAVLAFGNQPLTLHIGKPDRPILFTSPNGFPEALVMPVRLEGDQK